MKCRLEHANSVPPCIFTIREVLNMFPCSQNCIKVTVTWNDAIYLQIIYSNPENELVGHCAATLLAFSAEIFAVFPVLLYFIFKFTKRKKCSLINSLRCDVVASSITKLSLCLPFRTCILPRNQKADYVCTSALNAETQCNETDTCRN